MTHDLEWLTRHQHLGWRCCMRNKELIICFQISSICNQFTDIRNKELENSLGILIWGCYSTYKWNVGIKSREAVD